MTNGKFLSVEHRVLASYAGPRVSVPCFFMAGTEPIRKHGPIKELLSEDDPPRYKEVTVAEYYVNYRAKGLDGTSNLDDFKAKGLQYFSRKVTRGAVVVGTWVIIIARSSLLRLVS